MIRHRLAARRLLATALILAACAAHALDVRVAAQEALAPKWVHAHGRVTGICPDMMAAVERVQPRLRFTGMAKSRSLPGIEAGLRSGSLDAACALVSTPARLAMARRVGEPVYVTRHLLAARADDSADVATMADLARSGDLVTSHRGSAFTERMKAAGVRVDDATDDNLVNLRKMLAGHGRYAYLNELTLYHYLRTERLAGRVRILPSVLDEDPAYFWVSRKAHPALAPLLDEALGRLKANGELDRIYARWAARP
jgi:glutamate/aspartate transport system substrate-binding protein